MQRMCYDRGSEEFRHQLQTREEPKMNCPNCNTWNPEDKELCWRCQTPLPKPKPPKKKKDGGFSSWVWILIVALFAVTALAQCFFMPMRVPGQ